MYILEGGLSTEFNQNITSDLEGSEFLQKCTSFTPEGLGIFGVYRHGWMDVCLAASLNHTSNHHFHDFSIAVGQLEALHFPQPAVRGIQ